MASNREKYVELSIAGKWIQLAREVILDNQGLTEMDFIKIAAPLMPTHIRRNGKKAGRVELATEAIRHLVHLTGVVALVDGKLTSKPRRDLHGPSSKQVIEFALNNKTVKAKDLPNVKGFSVIASRLCRRGILKKTEPGVFAIKEATNDQT